LHGWTQTSDFWKPYIDQFAAQYKVYAIDLRGHGKSSPLNREFSIQEAAMDIAELIRALGLRQVNAVGFSFGGMVLLEMAHAHKDMIRSMAIIGASYQYDGALAQQDKPAFTYDNLDESFKSYLRVQHVHGEDQVRAMFDPNLNYRINISEAQLKSLQTRVLIINGDSDEIADIRQAANMKKLIPQSALWVVPNTGHLALNESNREEFLRLVKTFFAR
jgi:pimeloyl-ACP methyl ester carboxylesterase